MTPEENQRQIADAKSNYNTVGWKQAQQKELERRGQKAGSSGCLVLLFAAIGVLGGVAVIGLSIS